MMDILLTYDYELFFGAKSGSPGRCMLEPTNRLLEILDRADARATFFIDVGYLVRCRSLDVEKDNHDAVVRQIRQMLSQGHDVQFHIHPHWEDCTYRSGAWLINTDRYRLHDFSTDDAAGIIRRYSAVFEEVVGSAPLAFRAGGWCLQPFNHIADALFDVGVRIESTVFVGGRNVSAGRSFDFRGAPTAEWWRFDTDPLRPSHTGRFMELPITAQRVGPAFYWRVAVSRLLSGSLHSQWGDGQSVPQSKSQMLSLLLFKSIAPLTVDGVKASLMWRAYQESVGRKVLIAVGHPKAQTAYSFDVLEELLSAAAAERFITISEWWTENQSMGMA